jgi:CO/xanthine dehydrogenase Mo-binding subunit
MAAYYSAHHCGRIGPECLPGIRLALTYHDPAVGVMRAGLRRQEGAEKVTGTIQFTADLDVAGLLHAQLVLSHLPSARIRRIDTTAAREAPGVLDVVTGADLPVLELAGPDKPLAVDRVFYAGQPVAAVVAQSEAAAADAAALVEVEYEELEPAAEPEQAMADGAPLVLPAGEGVDEGDASIHGASVGGDSALEARPRNVSGIVHLKRGDTVRALAHAEVVVKATYSIAGVHQAFIEPHVCTVRPEPDGGLTIWSPTQGPFLLRNHVAELTGLPGHKVRVFPMPVGGGFGGKFVLLEPLVALLALRLRRPVRLALHRSQEFLVGRPAPAAKLDMELGASRDGTLVALRARYHYDNGAAAGWHAGLTGQFLAGTYRLPNFDVQGMEVSTNKTPADAYRAPGAPQAYFALESALDELAIRLGVDPIDLRLRNVSREGDLMPDGERWPRIGSVECLLAAKEHPLYTAPLGPDEGVGVALGSWGGARTPAAAGCRVEADGTLTLQVGSPDISGSATGLALIAAEAFGVSPDKVRVEIGDTGTAPFGPGAGGSQVMYSVGGAVHEAALEARRQLLEIATEELEAAPEDLLIVDGTVTVKGAPGRAVAITKLVGMTTEFRGKYRPIHASGRSAVQSASPMFTVHIARIRRDHETGAFQLTGYAAIQDVGRAINPPDVVGQVHGGVTQALGRALGEQLVYEGGQLRSGTFLDYELPTADQLPEIQVHLVEIPSPGGPLGAKGVGEPPAVPGAAALANAVSRAAGVRVRSVPIDRSLLVKI